jgi:hypothetical protein
MPVFVIGRAEVAGERSPRDWLVGEWFEPQQLAQMRGLIGRVGDPPLLHTIVYDEKLNSS